MRLKSLALAACALTLFNIAPASAQYQDPIMTLPEGHVILNISATEQREVPQDLLVGTLSYVAQNRDSRALQNEINTAMTKAVEIAKATEDVKVSTGAYQVYEITDERSKETLWRGNQTITIESMKPEAVLTLAGKLQDMKLTMNGLSYTLAPATAIEVQDSLMEAALAQLQTRADRAAKALGKTAAELRDVQVNSSGIPYQPMVQRGAMMKMEMAADSMAAPVAESGDTTLSLNVSARAILKP
jgi:predicted secreted protein